MAARDPDVLILGATVDGLVAAAMLAKAGRTVLVVEGGETYGGRARTEEFHKGFKCSATLHASGGLLPKVVDELELKYHGLLELMPFERGVTTLRTDGAPFHLPADGAEAAARKLSAADGRGYERVYQLLERLTTFLRPLLTLQPLPFKRPSLLEMIAPAWQAMRFRRLGEADMLELLRIAPQCLYDFTEDWFESDVLRATIAFPGLLGSFAGPRAPGTTAGLLLHDTCSFGGPLRRGGLPKGGMGSVGHALEQAAHRSGAILLLKEPVAKILLEGGEACGVELESGRILEAKTVLSSLGPRTTFLNLLDPFAIGPTFRKRLLAYRNRGCVAQVRFALDALPESKTGELELAGHVQVGEHLDELERAFDDAKYGRWASRPVMDLAFPTLTDPSLAPDGKHVCTALVHYAPYELADGSWDQQRSVFGDTVVSRLDELLPGFGDRILAREVLTPVDLEERYGLEGGHLLGGDLALDQLFTNRPVPELGTYRSPISRLYLTGAGTHPGGYMTGAAGYNAARKLLRDWGSL